MTSLQTMKGTEKEEKETVLNEANDKDSPKSPLGGWMGIYLGMVSKSSRDVGRATVGSAMRSHLSREHPLEAALYKWSSCAPEPCD